MAIKFFVQSSEYGILQIPVNPESIRVRNSSNNRVVNVLGLGDVNVLRNPKLEEYSFECFSQNQVEYTQEKVILQLHFY